MSGPKGPFTPLWDLTSYDAVGHATRPWRSRSSTSYLVPRLTIASVMAQPLSLVP
jgi:hypothetical protein